MEYVTDTNADKYVFYKRNKGDKVWWVWEIGVRGKRLISFDKKIIYNLWRDYPKNLSVEEKALFDKENSYWRKFFNGK